MKNIILLFGLLGRLAAQPLNLTVQSPPPVSVTGVTGTYQGSGPLNTPIFYWVVARYSTGLAAPAGPVAVTTPGGIAAITPGTPVRLSWRPEASATGYDIIRSTNAAYPGGGCGNCAVVLNSAGPPANDTGSTANYPPAGLSPASTAVGIITVNNQDSGAPYLTVDFGPGPLHIQTGIGLVSSVFGRSGAVIAANGDYTASQVTNAFNVTVANQLTNVPAPGLPPPAGTSSVWVDSTSKNLSSENDAGVVNHGIQSHPAVTSNWIRSISDDGSSAGSQPACGNLSDSGPGCSASSLPPGGPAGGGLSGNYPNPDVAAVAFTQTGTGAVATTLEARAFDLVNARTDFAADNTGAVDATTPLQNALASVIASGKKCLYIPAGTYKISGTTGTLFDLTSAANGLCVYGDGAGVTVLQYASSVTLTGTTNVFRLGGIQQSIRGLSILNGAGMTGAFDWFAIAINNGAYNASVLSVEIAGIYGSGTAGGGGITTYQPFAQAMVNTTAGGSIATGAQTVTPPSMQFIYTGQRLIIGGSTETVVVTATTATTFTATFLNTHIAADTITSNSQGYQGNTIANCYIHDSLKASAIVLNSNDNVVTGNRIIAVGSNTNQHGIYDQGGGNRILSNYVEGISGYAIHGHKAVPQADSNASVYGNNVLINYGSGGIIVDSISSDGVNPQIPSGTQLNRSTVITGNYVHERLGYGTGVLQGINALAPAVISANMLDDACGSTTSCTWISVSSGGSSNGTVVSGNQLNVVNASSGAGQVGIALGSTFSVSTGNVINNWNQAAAGVKLNTANTASKGDTVNGSATVASLGMALNANNTAIENCTIQSNSLGIVASQAVTGVRVRNCQVTMISASQVAIKTSTMQGLIEGNQVTTGYISYVVSETLTGIYLRNNNGSIFTSNSANGVTVQPNTGTLIPYPAGTNVITSTTGLAVTLSSGLAATALTTDTLFVGWVTGNKTSASGSVYVVGQTGATFTGATDGAWTAGNYGILSVTSAGKLHDAGTTTPLAGSYVQFLDTGGGAGTATFLILRTF